MHLILNPIFMASLPAANRVPAQVEIARQAVIDAFEFELNDMVEVRLGDIRDIHAEDLIGRGIQNRPNIVAYIEEILAAVLVAEQAALDIVTQALNEDEANGARLVAVQAALANPIVTNAPGQTAFIEQLNQAAQNLPPAYNPQAALHAIVNANPALAGAQLHADLEPIWQHFVQNPAAAGTPEEQTFQALDQAIRAAANVEVDAIVDDPNNPGQRLPLLIDLVRAINAAWPGLQNPHDEVGRRLLAAIDNGINQVINDFINQAVIPQGQALVGNALHQALQGLWDFCFQNGQPMPAQVVENRLIAALDNPINAARDAAFDAIVADPNNQGQILQGAARMAALEAAWLNLQHPQTEVELRVKDQVNAEINVARDAAFDAIVEDPNNQGNPLQGAARIAALEAAWPNLQHPQTEVELRVKDQVDAEIAAAVQQRVAALNLAGGVANAAADLALLQQAGLDIQGGIGNAAGAGVEELARYTAVVAAELVNVNAHATVDVILAQAIPAVATEDLFERAKQVHAANTAFNANPALPQNGVDQLPTPVLQAAYQQHLDAAKVSDKDQIAATRAYYKK